jgi:glycine/D-amino acid oxidase-like deaminating enzyme
VVGAGVAGLCLALELKARGLQPVVIEAARVGSGSTAASTALLLWETDLDFRKLAGRLGTERATRVWGDCLATLDWLEGVGGNGGLTSFARAQSVYYASRPTDADDLREEAAARESRGLPSRFVEDPEPWLGFRAPGAIVSERAAVANPIRLLRDLLEACSSHGIPVHENSPATRVTAHRVEGPGFTLESGHAVVAAGLAALPLFRLPPLVYQRRTYVLALEGDPAGWRPDVAAWSTARPYAYLRRAEGAVILGGEDLPPRKARAAGEQPYRRLRERAERMYPELAGARERARWSGLFPNSPDGLPFVGRAPKLEGADAVLGFGGNGIVFGVLGARLLARRCAGENVGEELETYDFGRLTARSRARLHLEQALNRVGLR